MLQIRFREGIPCLTSLIWSKITCQQIIVYSITQFPENGIWATINIASAKMVSSTINTIRKNYEHSSTQNYITYSKYYIWMKYVMFIHDFLKSTHKWAFTMMFTDLYKLGDKPTHKQLSWNLLNTSTKVSPPLDKLEYFQDDCADLDEILRVFYYWYKH